MRNKFIIGTLLLLNVNSIVAQLVGANKKVNPYKYSIVKNGEFKNASVSSAHALASNVGAAIMQQGGNAFDAAIATQLVLAVVYPNAGNIGGGGFLVAHTKAGKNIAIDYREKAPEKASRDMYIDAAGNAQTSISQNGHLASGVPGTVAGLFATLPYAKLHMKTLIQPAIDIAEFGFVITEREANGLNGSAAAFTKYSTQPNAFVKNNKWKAGDTLVQKELAATLKRIRDNGQKGFYEGTTADLIVAEMQRGNGIITKNDLKNYTARIREALQFTYKKNYTIIGMPPPSSGGIIIAQMMKMIEKFPIAAYGFQSVKATQLMVEVERRAYADRAEHLGDPDFYKVPLKSLYSNAYLHERMSNYDSTKATPSSAIKAGLVKESEETTHLSVMDKEGNMVSVTTTLNDSYGNKTIVGGAGFLLNNEMDDFSIKPGVANMYGAIGGVANAIVPGKRMLSSMTPTIVLKNNQPYIVAGTPGGTTIPTSVFQTLVNIIEFDMNAADAVNMPKFHHQWQPDEVLIEPQFSIATKTAMEKMGYKLVNRNKIGRTEVIKILPNKLLQTAADTRGDDSVAGF